MAMSARVPWAAPHRRRLLENGPGRRRAGGGRSLLQTDTDTILEAVQALSLKQDALDTKVEAVKSNQALANQEANEHHADASLENIIKAGFDDLKKGTDSLSASLEEILAKQQQALAAAQESLQIQERTNALSEAAERAIDKLEAAVQKQKESINKAYLDDPSAKRPKPSRSTSPSKRMRRASDKVKENVSDELAVPDEGAVLLVHAGQLQQHRSADRVLTLHRPQQPRVSRHAGVRGAQKPKTTEQPLRRHRRDVLRGQGRACSTTASTCVQARPGAAARLLRQLRDPHDVYNGGGRLTPESFLDNDGDGSPAVTGNFAPYCSELYNPRDIPYGFRHKSLPGYDAGFPYFFDINLSADEAQRWVDVMNYGLMIDEEQDAKGQPRVSLEPARELGLLATDGLPPFSEGGNGSSRTAFHIDALPKARLRLGRGHVPPRHGGGAVPWCDLERVRGAETCSRRRKPPGGADDLGRCSRPEAPSSPRAPRLSCGSRSAPPPPRISRPTSTTTSTRI